MLRSRVYGAFQATKNVMLRGNENTAFLRMTLADRLYKYILVNLKILPVK